MTYRAPVEDLRWLMRHVARLDTLAELPAFADLDDATVEGVLSGAAHLAEDKLAPLNRAGDLHPARLENGVVRTSPGFAEGYRAIAEGGWVSVSAPAAFGGAGLPVTLGAAVNEMMSASCMALQLMPLLTQGQITALARHADPALQALYLPRLIDGRWSATMNLTEPQAGSDVGALRSRAEPAGDGTYRITGQKIYITWADADFIENVVHLVLARLPDAPAGTRGISLFLVPRNIPGPDGTPGPRNSLRVESLEHKLGIHGSPTAVMSYEGATGWLIGDPGAGLAAMFTMMNAARLATGIQGVGVAEAAYQHALAFARERRQGRTGGPEGVIAEHPDVRRMLAEMRADIVAARAVALSCAAAIDRAEATGDAAWAAQAAVLTPIAKAFCSETGHAVAQEAIQVFGGMGYVEETGAAQFARDARIAAIYEGTNGIQAMDLVARKLGHDGAAALALIDELCDTAEAARLRLPGPADALFEAANALTEATEWLVAAAPEDRGAGAMAYLRAFGTVLGAAGHLRSALAEDRPGPWTQLCEIYTARRLPRHASLLTEARAGAASLFALGLEDMTP